MLKKFYKRIRLKFRQSKSDRVSSNSYRNYNQKIKRYFSNVSPFRKLKK